MGAGDHKISYILIGQLIYVSKVVNKFVKKRESINIMILIEVKIHCYKLVFMKIIVYSKSSNRANSNCVISL